MRIGSSLGPFRGQWSSVGGSAPAGYASALLNVQVGDASVRPRRGFRNLAGKPSGIVSVSGLACLSGYTAAGANILEWVSIEDRGAGSAPYHINPATWARTVITNSGSAVVLGAGKWRGFAFDANSYWVNPDAAPSLYRHEVGNIANWAALQDSAYVPPVDDPTITAVSQPVGGRSWLAGDVATTSAADSVINRTTALGSDGSLIVSGDDNDNGVIGSLVLTMTPAASINLSGSDYIAFEVVGGAILQTFNLGGKVEIEVGGVFSTPEQHETLNADSSQVAYVVRLRGVTVTAVQAIRITVRSHPKRFSHGVACTFKPMTLGGTYLGSTASGHRPWDATYEVEDITYGVRYRNLSTSAATGVKGVTVDKSRLNTLSVGPSGPLGAILQVAASPDLTSPYFDDPTGATCVMDIVRMDDAGVWRLLATKPNTTGQSINDPKEYWELAGLATVPGGSYVSPQPAPVFEVGQLVSGFPYKGSVVWLYARGKTNIRFSAVGNAESLHQTTDDIENIARGADFTMADDFADSPLGGVQAGQVAMIVGKAGAYSQNGDYPSTMTPPRKMPGSMGGAGPFAFSRYRDSSGNPGMAWLDVSGENVWFASAASVYSGDSQARPDELTLPIRGSVRSFLLDEQREALPGIALADAVMDVDESTGSLWVVLGQRALILRPPSPLDGQQHWERYYFALGSATSVVSACSDPFGPSSGIDQARSGGTLTWTNPNDVIVGAGVASTSAYLPGIKSHWVKGLAFIPGVLLPAEATLTALTLRVRQRATSSGDAPCPVKLANIDAYNGATLKYSATGALVATSWENVDIDLPLASMATDVAGINAGDISARIAYDAIPNTTNAYDPSNWSIVVAPVSPTSGSSPGSSTFTTNYIITATWIGAGAAPAYVPLSITSYAEGSVDLPAPP